MDKWQVLDFDLDMSINDEDSGIKSIKYIVDNEEEIEFVANELINNKNIKIPVTKDGEYTIEIIVEDNSGNISNKVFKIKKMQSNTNEDIIENEIDSEAKGDTDCNKEMESVETGDENLVIPSFILIVGSLLVMFIVKKRMNRSA